MVGDLTGFFLIVRVVRYSTKELFCFLYNVVKIDLQRLTVMVDFFLGHQVRGNESRSSLARNEANFGPSECRAQRTLDRRNASLRLGCDQPAPK